MLKVKVKLCSLLEEIAKQPELLVSMEEGSNLQNLIRALTDKYGEDLKKRYYLDADFDFSQYFLISVNNEIVSASNLAAVELKPGDTVETFEPVAGG